MVIFFSIFVSCIFCVLSSCYLICDFNPIICIIMCMVCSIIKCPSWRNDIFESIEHSLPSTCVFIIISDILVSDSASSCWIVTFYISSRKYCCKDETVLVSNSWEVTDLVDVLLVNMLVTIFCLFICSMGLYLPASLLVLFCFPISPWLCSFLTHTYLFVSPNTTCGIFCRFYQKYLCIIPLVYAAYLVRYQVECLQISQTLFGAGPIYPSPWTLLCACPPHTARINYLMWCISSFLLLSNMFLLTSSISLLVLVWLRRTKIYLSFPLLMSPSTMSWDFL